MSPCATSFARFFEAFCAPFGVHSEKLSSSLPSFTSWATSHEKGAT